MNTHCVRHITVTCRAEKIAGMYRLSAPQIRSASLGNRPRLCPPCLDLDRLPHTWLIQTVVPRRNRRAMTLAATFRATLCLSFSDMDLGSFVATELFCAVRLMDEKCWVRRAIGKRWRARIPMDASECKADKQRGK